MATETVTVISPSECILTAVLSEEMYASMRVFPNPFVNKVTFQFDNNSSLNADKVLIYNSLGILVNSIRLNNNVSNVEVENLQSGMYFYKILKGNTVLKSGKMISEM